MTALPDVVGAFGTGVLLTCPAVLAGDAVAAAEPVADEELAEPTKDVGVLVCNVFDGGVGGLDNDSTGSGVTRGVVCSNTIDSPFIASDGPMTLHGDDGGVATAGG